MSRTKVNLAMLDRYPKPVMNEALAFPEFISQSIRRKRNGIDSLGDSVC
jgi:hypothetical protein